jgi:micrococcal nuclease
MRSFAFRFRLSLSSCFPALLTAILAVVPGATGSLALGDDESSESSVLIGTVAKIIDGDSVIIKGEDGNEQQVHLEGIDAPEVKQPWGDKATKALDELIKGKKVEVKWKKKDDYQRILGQIYQEDAHINLEMLKKGLAWHFKRYYKSELFEKAEAAAKGSKVGLWSDSDPTPPWDYRKNNRDKSK